MKVETAQSFELILKQCPICGAAGIFVESWEGIRAECSARFTTCPCSIRTKNFQTRLEAARAFNMRIT